MVGGERRCLLVVGVYRYPKLEGFKTMLLKRNCLLLMIQRHLTYKLNVSLLCLHL